MDLAHRAAIARNDARAFLAAMLQGVKSVVRQFGGIGMAKDAKDAAVMFWIGLHQAKRSRRHETGGATPAQAHSFALRGGVCVTAE